MEGQEKGKICFLLWASWLPGSQCVMADVSSQREEDNFSSHITARAVMIGCLEGPQDSGRSVCMYVCEC